MHLIVYDLFEKNPNFSVVILSKISVLGIMK